MAKNICNRFTSYTANKKCWKQDPVLYRTHTYANH